MALKSTNIDPRIVELNDKPIVQPQSQTNFDPASTLLDKDWAKSAFLISDNNFTDKDDIINRYWSVASAKFTDGRLGCKYILDYINLKMLIDKAAETSEGAGKAAIAVSIYTVAMAIAVYAAVNVA
jgi:hypothetical protein